MNKQMSLNSSIGVPLDRVWVALLGSWKLANEARGGHIPGAKMLPVKWTNYIDWIEIVRSKHILPENKIIIYISSNDF